mmetsp:Transcript_107601/g.273139  ORF Transcript_107601/g.273139 Transcript_107601/m.273139 type:complete len:273 (+) Transcript_107601:957-1775(+)
MRRSWWPRTCPSPAKGRATLLFWPSPRSPRSRPAPAHRRRAPCPTGPVWKTRATACRPQKPGVHDPGPPRSLPGGPPRPRGGCPPRAPTEAPGQNHRTAPSGHCTSKAPDFAPAPPAPAVSPAPAPRALRPDGHHCRPRPCGPGSPPIPRLARWLGQPASPVQRPASGRCVCVTGGRAGVRRRARRRARTLRPAPRRLGRRMRPVRPPTAVPLPALPRPRQGANGPRRRRQARLKRGLRQGCSLPVPPQRKPPRRPPWCPQAACKQARTGPG